MKKIVFLLLISTLLLTSCVTAIKTKEIFEDVKAPVTDEKEETPEAPKAPAEPVVPITPETTLDPEEMEEPEIKDEVTEEPEKTINGDVITPDENETPAIEVGFNEITEEELENIFDTNIGGQTIELPAIPIG